MALPSDLCHLLDRPEFQTAGGAVGHAGRFQALVDPVHAVIAFFNLSGLLIPLGRAPWAGRYAGFASHAQLFFHKYNAVLAALLHGAGGAG